MRDRLIELLGDFPIFHSTMKERWMPEAVERLADYLLAEGVIVPKVKIGDKLHAINAAWTRVNEYTVTHLEMYACGVKIFGRPIYCREEYWLCWNQDLGNDECCVFLTREEAEKALAERRGDGTNDKQNI